MTKNKQILLRNRTVYIAEQALKGMLQAAAQKIHKQCIASAAACSTRYANSKTLMFPIEFAEIMVLCLRLQQTLDTN